MQGLRKVAQLHEALRLDEHLSDQLCSALLRLEDHEPEPSTKHSEFVEVDLQPHRLKAEFRQQVRVLALLRHQSQRDLEYLQD